MKERERGRERERAKGERERESIWEYYPLSMLYVSLSVGCIHVNRFYPDACMNLLLASDSYALNHMTIVLPLLSLFVFLDMELTEAEFPALHSECYALQMAVAQG